MSLPGGTNGSHRSAQHEGAPVSTADFAFPLNVYARMLERAEGRLDYLHYGLFETVDEPVWRAQERASERLWRVLPPPCRLLEVGIGVGTTLRRLGEAGYRATGITPDAAQVAEVRRRHGDRVDARVSTLESLSPGPQPFDAMLLQESAQYIDPLALFEAADRLLADPGCIVLMDEFALRRPDAAASGLHVHAHVLALAQRMGWTVEHDEDVSALAAPTVQAIASLIQRQKAALQAELQLQAGQLDALVDAAQRYRERYAQGQYGYRLLRLVRRSRPALRLSAVGAGHSAAMRSLFEQVFERPMSEAEWQWKYGQGRGHAVGLWRDGALLAHYGAATREVLIDGRVERAAQVGDVMVLPEANAGLGRQGALQQVSATLLEQQIGWGAPHRVGFGFPNARAMRVAERLGLYAAVDEVVQLEWQGALPPRRADRLWRLHEVDPARLDTPGDDTQALAAAWRAMAAALPRSLLPVRGPAWLCHRYGRRPGVRYRLWRLSHRLGLRPGGAFVLREQGDHVELLDLVGPPAAWPELVRQARLQGLRLGQQRLLAWVTRSHADRLDDPVTPAQRVEIGVQVPSCAHTAGPAPQALRGRWFLMGGDTDFR